MYIDDRLPRSKSFSSGVEYVEPGKDPAAYGAVDSPALEGGDFERDTNRTLGLRILQ